MKPFPFLMSALLPVSAMAETSPMRGFFAVPPSEAASQGRAGAGASLAQNAMAAFTNPAALGLLHRPNLAFSRSLAPDGSPRLASAFAWRRGRWIQGPALHYAGDGLASEALAAWALGFDPGGSRFSGIFLGAAAKLYLAQVGEEGTGLDRSRGRSAGFGLDLGAILPLEKRIRLALVFRDVPGRLWHQNEFTDRSASETLPPEFRAGAAARAGERLEFFLEGQRALLSDAPVHVRAGLEQELFRILRARAGYHQIYGEETVRRFSVGLGLDTHGLRLRPRLALQYAFEYGLGDHEALAGSEAFSLEVGF